MDKELVVERSYLVAGKATSSKYLVIGSWINFPVTWGGARERWSEMARPRRVVALLAMAVLAVFVLVFIIRPTYYTFLTGFRETAAKVRQTAGREAA